MFIKAYKFNWNIYIFVILIPVRHKKKKKNWNSFIFVISSDIAMIYLRETSCVHTHIYIHIFQCRQNIVSIQDFLLSLFYTFIAIFFLRKVSCLYHHVVDTPWYILLFLQFYSVTLIIINCVKLLNVSIIIKLIKNEMWPIFDNTYNICITHIL